MEYNIIKDNNKVIIEGIRDFDPVHIFECGQCFRWNREEDGSFTGVAFERVLNVKVENDKVILSNTNIEEFNNIWYDYFDLGRDYGKMKEIFSQDEILKEAVKFGSGIRILNQEPFEILISFIISANNAIPRIKSSIERLSKRYGKHIGEYNGKEYYAFPTAEALSKVDIEELKETKIGFRAKYVSNAAKKVYNEGVNLDYIKTLDTTHAREELMEFQGVGPKVSDCILLFSMEKYEAFPIDVWVKRIMEYFYLKEDTSMNKIQKYGEEKFKDLAGFAQQYLFYYARELGIGKKKK